MEVVVSATVEDRINLSRDMDPSPSRCASDLASESPPCTVDSPDRDDQFSSSPNPNKVSESQSSVSLRSEEYRQLFRLPSDEVLVQDFNCAFQESILLQGHMYLFVHYICFYSNIFGFETKKIIPFNEITIVRQAKTAGIFPNAIEIFAGGRKYFFASFLSRDEAFKLINDLRLQHGNGSQAISEQQDSSSETSSPDNGPVVIEKVNDTNHYIDKQNSIRRDKDVSDDSKQTFNVENDLSTPMEIQDDNEEHDAEQVVNVDPSSSAKTLSWKIENYDAPKMPECFTKVAETKFLMKVEEFFHLFFSDDAAKFTESFHRKCGDKEFRCTSWKPHDEFGHARDVSFQHPIKIYFGAKFGSCQEIQKFRVYKNSHLVIETSQEINDVPYGDYFCVQGLWDVEKYDNESKEGCILRVYVNVAFSKKTVWKGKIVQSTLEECQEAYEMWIGMAHDLLKQKNLEKREESGPTASSMQNGDVHTEREVKTGESSERLSDIDDQLQTVPESHSVDTNQQVGNLLQGSLIGATTFISLLRESVMTFCSYLKSQNHVSLILVIAFAVIILMQVSILVLLNRPQHIHVASPSEYMVAMGGGIGERSAETMAWLEKRMHYLKDEMRIVEAWLERMQREYVFLKAQFKDLEHLRNNW
ncbi:protein VASCULAR ASSOCIATED DEATH 1, chloroplastic-like [Mangifera indica]|uniref:protein VASCULAR ASSOCIATED DEATH 1, chloroplastic-like n=1 Tax=Mangifera indica TaxID=29780 RepID=UPI001CFB048E|nr:protein VASCULAR ASSOCIATED DEATH 1, chloroplastic-like [Mangifera indica]